MSTTSNTQSTIPEQSKFENLSDSTPVASQQPGIAQQVYDGVTNFVSSTANALPNAASLIPGGFTGSTSQTTSTPQHPITHTGGVGDLPGTTSEVDVARLPEERAHPDPLSETTYDKLPSSDGERNTRVQDATERGYAAAEPAGRGTHDKFGGSNVGTNLDHQHGLGFEHTGTKVAALGGLTSSDRSNVQPKTTSGLTGIGANTNTQDTSTTTQPTFTEYGTGKGVGGITHDGQARSGGTDHFTSALDPSYAPNTSHHHDQSRPQQVVDRAKEKVGATGTNNTRTSPTSSPTDLPSTSPSHKLKEKAGVTGTTNTQTSTSASPIDTSPTSPSHKATFMDKVKGEMKIVSGKMSKDSDKVEQGRALKSGTN